MIEQYVAEVCEQLNCDPLRRDEIRFEIHAHLRDRAEALAAKGLDRQTAEAWAIEEFGLSDHVADRLNDAQPAYARPRILPHADFVSVLLIFSGVSGLVSALYFIIERVGHTRITSTPLHSSDLAYVAVLGAINLLKILFGYGLLSRRAWARKPVLWVAATIPLLMSTAFTVHWGLTFLQMATYFLGANLPSAFLAAYAVWALTGSRGRKIAWG